MNESNLTFRPIFIGGCDRSGTTLLGSMLGGGDHAVVTPESQFILVASKQAVDADNLEFLWHGMVSHWRFKVWGFEPKTPDFSSLLNAGYAGLIQELVRQYAESQRLFDRHIWVDHTPVSINNVHFLLELFPDAKFIHIVRDGRAVAASILNVHWGPNTIHSAAHWWMKKVCLGLAAELRFGKDKVVRIRYEDLIEEPEVTLENLCANIGLKFDKAMIKANAFKVPEYTSCQHKLVGHGPDINRSTSWQQSLKQREVEIFESLTDDLLPSLGYTKEHMKDIKSIARLELIPMQLIGAFRSMIGYFKQRKRKRKMNHE